jgi:hypothetical protein
VNHVGIAILAVATVFLGSCDHFREYHVQAVVIHGRLAFIVDPASKDQESCLNEIHVSADKGERARASPVNGDDVKLVANGVFWWKDLKPHCDDHFPVFYGQPLKGSRLVYNGDVSGTHRGQMSSVVEAKPLDVGVVYEVVTSSGILRAGHGWFRLTPDRHVENWPNDPTPSRLDAQGYDLSGPYKLSPSPRSNDR